MVLTVCKTVSDSYLYLRSIPSTKQEADSEDDRNRGISTSKDKVYNSQEKVYNSQDNVYNNQDKLYNNQDKLYNNQDKLYNNQKSHHLHSKHPQATTSDSLIEQKLIISHLNRESSCHS